jgi:CRP-like cAMP-binding protein
MPELHFQPGEVIFSQGDPSDHAYLIRSGTVEILTRRGEKSLRLALLGPGEVFGEMGLIQERPRSATARAATASTLATITREEFEHGLLHDPARCGSYLRSLFERLRSLTARLQEPLESGVPEPAAQTARLTLFPATPRAAQALPEEGLVIELLPFRIGRASEANEPQSLDLNDLWLLDEPPFNVSRNHLAIERSAQDRFLVRDRGSKLGTIVNDQWIGGQAFAWTADLQAGDNLLIVGHPRSPYQFRLSVAL